MSTIFQLHTCLNLSDRRPKIHIESSGVKSLSSLSSLIFRICICKHVHHAEIIIVVSTICLSCLCLSFTAESFLLNVNKTNESSLSRSTSHSVHSIILPSQDTITTSSETFYSSASSSSSSQQLLLLSRSFSAEITVNDLSHQQQP